MSIFTSQVIQIKTVSLGNIVPCITINRGVDIAARAGAAFDLPITVSYNSGGRTVTVSVNPKVSATQFIQVLNPQAVKIETLMANVPPPDPGAIATCTVNVTIKDQQQMVEQVFDPVTTTHPFT